MVFRAGIVGCGLMGTLHARTLAALPDVQVAAVQNHTPAKADTLAAEVGARFDTVEELVRSNVDAVWVCTPDFAHVEPSLAVLEAGEAPVPRKVARHDVGGRAHHPAPRQVAPGAEGAAGLSAALHPRSNT